MRRRSVHVHSNDVKRSDTIDGKYITGICTVFVAVLMVGGLLMPIIDHTTEGEPVINPDAGWIRMNYDTAASAYTINISASDDGITVANGTDTQTGDDETIYYADSNLAVWLEDGYFTVLGQSTNGPVFFQSEDDITITRDADGVTVTDGVNTVAVGAPTWAYVPYSSGSYGFFADGVAASTNNNPIVAVGGGFAGVYAYNDITRYAGLGLELQTVTDGGKITGAYWAKPSAEEQTEPLNPGSITPINPGLINGGDVDIQPIDPITIDPEPDVSILSMPTPTHTDGVWGFDIISGTNVKIVSYSGSSGDIVVPTTLTEGGVTYTVKQLGKGGSSSNNVFDPSITGTLTIPEGIEKINMGAVRQCGITEVTAAESVTSIGTSCFYGMSSLKKATFMGILTVTPGDATIFKNCTALEEFSCKGIDKIGDEMFNGCTSLAGILVIPDTVSYIGSSGFAFCGYETVVIPESVTQYGSTGQTFAYMNNLKTVVNCSDAALPTLAYYNSSSLSEILDLSDSGRYVAGSNGIPAPATIQDNIGDSIGYLGVAYIPGESDLSPSAVALMYVIPAIILVSLIIFGAVVFVRRDY